MKRHAVTQTEEVGEQGGALAGPPRPGLVLLSVAGRPLTLPMPFVGDAIDIGREAAAFATLVDPLLSRRHARVTFDGGRFTVHDLGSRNGTAVDGQRIHGAHTSASARVLRAGGTVALLCADIRPFLTGVSVSDELVMGPALRAAWDAIGRAARSTSTLHVSGESGTGKELAARAFHQRGPRARGPFVAVNCAAIPEGVAERLLFGARKGAYSGAASDADGYLQAAHDGTLFLDEIAELHLTVQAKLLRVLETREVLALGAAQPRPVNLSVCSATHRELRAEVAAGRLRADLYFRIGRPDVALPPLRERLEEIPWLIARELGRADAALTAQAAFVESCLLRPWPGNLRELLAEVRSAAQQALAAGSAEVTEQHLAPQAGRALTVTTTAAPPASAPARSVKSPPRTGPLDRPRKEALAALLAKHGGVVQAVAADLGCSRRQIGRWLQEYQISRPPRARRPED